MKKNFALVLLSICITSCIYPQDNPETEETPRVYEEELEKETSVFAKASPDKQEAPELFDVPDTEGDIYEIKTEQKKAPEKKPVVPKNLNVLEKDIRKDIDVTASIDALELKKESPELYDVPDTEGDIYDIKTNQPKPAHDKGDKSWFGKVRLKTNDIDMFLGALLRDEYFLYNHVNTLRSDFNDQNDFFKHKISLDWSMIQGKRRYGKPAIETFVRLTNYIFWQLNNIFMPTVIDNIQANNAIQPSNMNSNTNDLNASLGQNISVRTLMPLVFTEQAWLKINIDAFAPAFNNHPTFVQAGLFQYMVGRGISLGYHDDVGVEALGWPGEGYFPRFAYMPPGLLIRTQLMENLTLDFYFSKWREVSATLADTTNPTRKNRLFGPGPERGTSKDRDVWVVKADYTYESSDSIVTSEPYWIHCNAPELQVEFQADASAHINTLGMMVDVSHNNFKINVEVAGQFGAQKVHAIDRNIIKLNSQGQAVLSHVVFQTLSDVYAANLSRTQVPVRSIVNIQSASFNPATTVNITNNIDYIVDQPINRSLAQQGEAILNLASSTILLINPNTGFQDNSNNGVPIYNSNTFGDKRFRCPYKLNYRGFMALADISYEFDELPLKLAGSLGYIGGDAYPYNEEVNKTFRGFTPLRTWYKGQEVENILFFDREAIPRPMNISYNTMYAFNNTRNPSDLQFIGLGLTWYPFQDRTKFSCVSETMFFWNVADLYKWDKCGKHPDQAIEAQIALDRTALGFCGWQSPEPASHRLGIETDIKVLYMVVEQCNIVGKMAFFFPGQLYRDLEGQPNILTRRIDQFGNSQYQSLGSGTAFAFSIGFDYRF